MVLLSEQQLNKLADIVSDIAIVALASVVLPEILDKSNFLSALIGLWVALFFWSISIWILKNNS